MRKIVSLVVLLGMILCGTADAQKSKSALRAEVNTNLPNNTTGLITPLIMRNTLTDIINSFWSNQWPVFDVSAYGAKGDNGTDDTAAINSAITAMCSGTASAGINTFAGGVLFFPVGIYKVSGTANSVIFDIPSNCPVKIMGAQNSLPSISTVSDATIFKVESQFSAIEGLNFSGKGQVGDTGTFGANNPTLWLTGGGMDVRNIQVFGGNPCIKITGPGDIQFWNVVSSLSYGDIMTVTDSGGWWWHTSFDQSYPFNTPAVGTVFNAWAANTPYTQGTVVTLNGYNIQAMTNGTSGTGAPGLKNYGVNIVDNSVTWQLGSKSSPIGLHFTGSTAETRLTSSDNAFPIVIDSSGSFFHFSHSNITGIKANSGGVLHLHNNEIGASPFENSASPVAVVLDSSWTGDSFISGNSINRNGNSTAYGVRIRAGTNTAVTNNRINTSNVGVLVDAGVTDFIIANNTFSQDTTGIQVSSGASDNYNIVSNLIHGSTTGISDAGTGTHKVVYGNGPGPITLLAPATVSALTYSVTVSDSSLVFSTPATTTTVTLPSAATNAGRYLDVKTVQNAAVNSASSNVTPLAGGSVSTGILTGTAGKWGRLQSDGSSWIIMQAN